MGTTRFWQRVIEGKEHGRRTQEGRAAIAEWRTRVEEVRGRRGQKGKVQEWREKRSARKLVRGWREVSRNGGRMKEMEGARRERIARSVMREWWRAGATTREGNLCI